MSKLLHGAVAAMVAFGGMATPVLAKDNRDQRTRYEYNGRTYNSLAACREQKRKSTRDGTIAGAAAAGIGAAVLGANLGESALIAGGGALVGNQLGKTKKC